MDIRTKTHELENIIDMMKSDLPFVHSVDYIDLEEYKNEYLFATSDEEKERALYRIGAMLEAYNEEMAKEFYEGVE